MSWPSMVYDLAIAKRSGAFVKKMGEGPKIREMRHGYQDDFQAIPVERGGKLYYDFLGSSPQMVFLKK